MKIYFIIPAYKAEEYLNRCVDSVLKQTYSDKVIVLVDDGSPDRCPQMCDAYAAKYDFIHVIHKENGGLADARNVALSYVESVADEEDYITFLDSDDFIRADYAEKMIALCEENGCGMAQCNYEKGYAEEFSAPSENKARTVVVKSSEEMLLDQRFKSLNCAKIFKMYALRGLRYPFGVLNEDEFIIYRAVCQSKKVVLCDDMLYYYFQHAESVMDNIANRLKNNPHLHDWLNAYKERIEFFEKEKKPVQVQRTHEKICSDVILRYAEQMSLPKSERDEMLTSGEYLRLYRQSFPLMIGRKGIALSRRLMYYAFYLLPISAVPAGKLFGLRK